MSRILAIVFAVVAHAANPVPLIQQPLGPSAVHPGSTAFTLKVKGDGFITSTVINWNGSPLATTFVSSQEVTAAVPGANVATAGTAAITAVNPAPKGGVSNTTYLPVIQPQVSNAMTAVATSATDNGPLSIVTGDFNRDGKLDVVTANQSANSISVLSGKGDGTFQAPVNYAGVAGQTVSALATGDFNNDGILDLALTSDNGSATGYFYILFGNADGTFQPLVKEIKVRNNPEGVAAADFNGDGNLDLAVSSYNTGIVSIFLGNGDGTFGPRTDYTSFGTLPRQLVAGDLNEDGVIDLAVLDRSGFVTILIGHGDGTFSVPQSIEADGNLQSLALADLNGDGLLDLIVGNSVTETVSVFLGSGGGLFKPRIDYNAGGEVVGVAVGDFNGDNKLDVAAATDSGLAILLGGQGMLQPALNFPVPDSSAHALVVADFNQDGRLDAVFTNSKGASITTMLQTPLVATPSSLTYPLQTVGTRSLPQAVEVTNIGAAALSLGSISVGAADPADFTISSDHCPASLAQAQSCRLEVEFTPTLKGFRTASLLITNSALGIAQPISLTGSGTIVSLAPPKLNFGTVTVGQTSAPLMSTITNVGTVTLNIFKISLAGRDAGGFGETNTCGSTLAPGASCSISVTFTPPITGIRTARVNINDDGNDGTGNSQSIALSGTGG